MEGKEIIPTDTVFYPIGVVNNLRDVKKYSGFHHMKFINGSSVVEFIEDFERIDREDGPIPFPCIFMRGPYGVFFLPLGAVMNPVAISDPGTRSWVLVNRGLILKLFTINVIEGGLNRGRFNP